MPAILAGIGTARSDFIMLRDFLASFAKDAIRDKHRRSGIAFQNLKECIFAS
jgi:hypothetical protein